MKVTAYIGFLCVWLITSCNRSETIFAPPPSGQSVAIIINPTSEGVNIDADADALDSVGYTFSGVVDMSITKYIEAGGRVTGARVTGSAEKTAFKDALAKLRKNKKLSGYRIFYIEDGSSERVEL